MLTASKVNLNDIQEKQFGLIRKKISSLIEVVFENVQSKDPAIQDRLCLEMCELESHVKSIYRRFPSNPINDNLDDLNAEVKWVDEKINLILKVLDADHQ